MKRNIIFSIAIFTLVVVSATLASAQLALPRQSQSASVTQRVGLTDISINYSRPAIKGRKIFGEGPKDSYAKGEATLDNQYKRYKDMPIVPNGHVWRTGANEATQFVITDDCMINGQKLAAGKYSLHTVPGKTEWTIIVNSDAGQWGSFSYDAAKDVLRVKAKPMWVKDSQELLNISFDPVDASSAIVNIRWEKVKVPFTVTVDAVGIAMAKARPMITAAKSDDWRIRYNVGTYAYDNGLKDEGTRLLTDALKIVDDSIRAKETWATLAGRANILLQLGRKDEGLAAADKAITFGKANKADTSALEKRIADIKAGKQ